jgi:predicted  nucleic acid-binding Zn-ribbon protein
VYRRSLHDYAGFFRQAYLRHKELDDSLARAKRDADTMIAMKVKVEEQVAAYTAEKLKLDSDLVGFRKELAEVTAYHQALATQWENTRARLSELYRTNDALAQELTQIQGRLAQEINQRAAEASVGAPAATPPAATSP